MIQLDLQDIRSLKAEGSSRNEALTLAPTEVFEQKYAEYRYFYVTLLKLMSSEAPLSAQSVTVCCRAFAELRKRIPVELAFLLKTEIALRVVSQSTLGDRKATARLKSNIEKVFKMSVSATELCLIHHEYGKFIERFYTRERRSSWQAAFILPLFALHHMQKRENEILRRRDCFVFLPAEERQIRQGASSPSQSEEVFPQLRQYSDATNFYPFWMKRLGFGENANSETETCVKPIDKASVSKDMSFELLSYIADRHKSILETFCALLLRSAGARSIEVQENLLADETPEDHGDTTQADQAKQHQQFSNKDLSSPLNSYGISWATRRETQLLFLLNCESVSRVSYRRKILASQLRRQGHTDVNSHQVKNDYDDWLSSRTERKSSVGEEAGMLRMLNYYRLRDRGGPSHRNRKSLRDMEGMPKANVLRIAQEDIQVAQRALRLFL